MTQLEIALKTYIELQGRVKGSEEGRQEERKKISMCLPIPHVPLTDKAEA